MSEADPRKVGQRRGEMSAFAADEHQGVVGATRRGPEEDVIPEEAAMQVPPLPSPLRPGVSAAEPDREEWERDKSEKMKTTPDKTAEDTTSTSYASASSVVSDKTLDDERGHEKASRGQVRGELGGVAARGTTVVTLLRKILGRRT